MPANPPTDPASMLRALAAEVRNGGAAYSGVSLHARIMDIADRLSGEPDGRLAKAAELLREVRAYDSHRDNTLACEYTAEGWIKERDEWLASFSTTKPAAPEPSAEPDQPIDAALTALLNSYSRENASNTPDFILAEYMLSCLRAFERASRDREAWYGIPLRIGMGSPLNGSER